MKQEENKYNAINPDLLFPAALHVFQHKQEMHSVLNTTGD
jgi:hypothetical protein